mgnify:FL=1
MNRIYTILAFVIPVIGFSNTYETTNPIVGTDIEQEGVDPEGYPNETDANGQKQGMWTIWGHMRPEKG